MSMSLRTPKNRACWLLLGIALVAANSSWASIIGGDANSIVGGDARSIVGGDLNSIIGSDFAAIGPVESLDLRKGVIVVLGQGFAIDQTTRFGFGGGSTSLGVKALKLLRVGDYIAVGGSKGTNATVRANNIVALRIPYVNGASQTYVKGPIGAINSALGQLTIGSLTIDYTAVLSTLDASSFSVGKTVEFAGIRPNQAGQLLAFTARVAETSSIIGGDANSIIGGDANSIVGGDLNGKSIIGGDANSIVGGDLNGTSIIGGDTNGKSIIGGDANSIVGGDLNGTSIIGGDVNSIIGGDAR